MSQSSQLHPPLTLPPPPSQLFEWACDSENQGMYYMSYLPSGLVTPSQPEQQEISNLLAECQRMSLAATLKINALEHEVSALNRFLQTTRLQSQQPEQTDHPSPLDSLSQRHQLKKPVALVSPSSLVSPVESQSKLDLKLEDRSSNSREISSSPLVIPFAPTVYANNIWSNVNVQNTLLQMQPTPYDKLPISTSNKQHQLSKKQSKNRLPLGSTEKLATVHPAFATPAQLSSRPGYTVVQYEDDYARLLNHYNVDQVEILLGDDFSKVRPPQNQVSLTVFWSFLEPWLRDLTEDDLRMLETEEDDAKSYTVPTLGASYIATWMEQDRALGSDLSGAVTVGTYALPYTGANTATSRSIQSMAPSRMHLQSNSAKGAMNGDSENKGTIAFPPELYAAPLTERLLCALIATGDQNIKMLTSEYEEEDLFDSPTQLSFRGQQQRYRSDSNANSVKELSAAALAQEKEDSDLDDCYMYTDSNPASKYNEQSFPPLPPLMSMPYVQSSQSLRDNTSNFNMTSFNSSIKKQFIDVNENREVESLEERLKVELQHLGLFDHNTMPTSLSSANDEICEKLRELQRQLRSQLDVNRKRKKRIFDIATGRMAFQEYQHVLGDVDKQLEQAFQARYCHKQSKKSKKTKVDGKAHGLSGHPTQSAKGPPTSLTGGDGVNSSSASINSLGGGKDGNAAGGVKSTFLSSSTKQDTTSGGVSSSSNDTVATLKGYSSTTSASLPSQGNGDGTLVSNNSAGSLPPASGLSAFPDNIRALMERRTMLIREIGSVFLESLLGITGILDRTGATSQLDLDDDDDVERALERRFWSLPKQSVFTGVGYSDYETWRSQHGREKLFTLPKDDITSSSHAASTPVNGVARSRSSTPNADAG